MTASTVATSVLHESQRIIQELERRQHSLPFVAHLLALHHTAHYTLEDCEAISEQAVDVWRAALAQRWDYEVEARRLYKQVVRQLSDQYGETAPLIHLITRGGAEINSSPSELVEDLQRLSAALTVEILNLPFASDRIAEINQIRSQLQGAIVVAQQTEQQRRNAVLENRMAREAFRRTSEATLGKLAAHYGERFHTEFQGLLEIAAA
jgi:hypothetical protein